MAMLDLLRATVTDGADSKNYYFLGNADVYTPEVRVIVAVAPAPEAEQAEPATKVERLQGAGKIFRLTCKLANGDRREVLCSRDKLGGAFSGLIGVACDGSTIETVSVSRKAIFY